MTLWVDAQVGRPSSVLATYSISAASAIACVAVASQDKLCEWHTS